MFAQGNGGRTIPKEGTHPGAVAMKNPWLDIPLDDYEGHMTLPQVAQAQMLAQLAADNHFHPLEARTVVAGAGKRFRLQAFRLAAGAL